MATDPERSPSPAIAPPIPLAPGPRASALQKLYADAVAHILKTCSYNNFSTCFPTPSSQVPASVKCLHEQFAVHLGRSMQDEFEKILVERDVVRGLNELDRLIEEAKRRKQEAGDNERVTPPHTIPAEQLYLSHLMPSLHQYSQEIKQKQQVLQADNVEILSRVMEQRKQIGAAMQSLETALVDVEASVAALEPQQSDDLRNEIRAVDDQIKMVS